MTPAERLDAAETAVDAMGLTDDQPNFAGLNALIAIGRLLQNIDNRQQQAGS